MGKIGGIFFERKLFYCVLLIEKAKGLVTHCFKKFTQNLKN